MVYSRQLLYRSTPRPFSKQYAMQSQHENAPVLCILRLQCDVEFVEIATVAWRRSCKFCIQEDDVLLELGTS
jgi:hypothetical protein